jgi:hypothetical protein
MHVDGSLQRGYQEGIFVGRTQTANVRNSGGVDVRVATRVCCELGSGLG